MSSHSHSPSPTPDMEHRKCCAAQQMFNYLLNPLKTRDKSGLNWTLAGSSTRGTSRLAFQTRELVEELGSLSRSSLHLSKDKS